MAKRGNGQGSVYQRESDKKWIAAVTLGYEWKDGKRRPKRKERVRSSKREAQAALKEMLLDQGQGKLAPGSRETVGQFVDWFLNRQLTMGEIRPQTEAAQRRLLRHAMTHIGTVRLSQLTPQKIDECYQALRQQGLSTSRVHQVHGQLHHVLRFAVKLDKIGRDPSEYIAPPAPKRERKQAMTTEQIRTLLAVESRYRSLWALLLATGLRISEALGLRWSDIDWQHGRFVITDQMIYDEASRSYRRAPLKTDSSERPVFLVDDLLTILRSWQKQQREEKLAVAIDEREDHDLIFCRKNGAPMHRASALLYLWADLETAGLPRFSLHELRHTHATLHRFTARTDSLVVQELLGHSQAIMTDHYSHVSDEEKQAAARNLGQLLFTAV